METDEITEEFSNENTPQNYKHTTHTFSLACCHLNNAEHLLFDFEIILKREDLLNKYMAKNLKFRFVVVLKRGQSEQLIAEKQLGIE